MPYEERSGIDGQFKTSSEIRRQVQGGIDPETGLLDINRGDVYTEVYSPAMVEKAYKDWANKGGSRGDTSREAFNNEFGEYYGQQALKLAGFKSPNDDDRSYSVKLARAREVNSGRENRGAGGTDRLIEYNRGLGREKVASTVSMGR